MGAESGRFRGREAYVAKRETKNAISIHFDTELSGDMPRHLPARMLHYQYIHVDPRSAGSSRGESSQGGRIGEEMFGFDGNTAVVGFTGAPKKRLLSS